MHVDINPPLYVTKTLLHSQSSTKYRSIPKGRPHEVCRASLESNKFAMLWAADNRNSVFLDLRVQKKSRVTRYLAFLWEYFGILIRVI
jgi:hypothetical protein